MSSSRKARQHGGNHKTSRCFNAVWTYSTLNREQLPPRIGWAASISVAITGVFRAPRGVRRRCARPRKAMSGASRDDLTHPVD